MCNNLRLLVALRGCSRWLTAHVDVSDAGEVHGTTLRMPPAVHRKPGFRRGCGAHGYPWVPMGTDGHPWASMGPHGAGGKPSTWFPPGYMPKCAGGVPSVPSPGWRQRRIRTTMVSAMVGHMRCTQTTGQHELHPN